MDLILRKNDSATSLLLFIYNHYVTETSNDRLKLSSLLEILKVFDKNESAIRMSLSRAVKSNVLVNSREDGDVYYTLSHLGRESIESWNKGVNSYWRRYHLRHLPWNGKWYLINIEFPDDKKQKSEMIDQLHQIGFSFPNSKIGISPYDFRNEVDTLTKKYGMEKDILEMYGDMYIKKEMKEFLEEVYHIEILKKRYEEFIGKWSGKFQELKEECRKDHFVGNGLALPVLHELGWQFFSIAANDAVLPIDLYPLWEGDRAAAIMKDLKGLLLEASIKYLVKFK
ncbi:hypothetical protein [Sinanaerobacter chloroacetimidivorans]|jgi:phenylacetic acid degradation operon negative regulatory protein|uniref:PaaX family transcriptional regulator n=1 Tax=Sinanaerobacter chloroacetimidivorans TaxID=2818044 RepID=A0A8J7W801_9FIRM|nr:hypothetical protein [Sinanaerobacter chloroacetimidivorans]MBR0600616.1 hypothetical protein [Sinanaerobacter chloroacetimidivorans]